MFDFKNIDVVKQTKQHRPKKKQQTMIKGELTPA
jgi:hypothetical protein